MFCCFISGGREKKRGADIFFSSHASTRYIGNRRELLQLMTQVMGILYKKQKQWHFVELVHALGLGFIYTMRIWLSKKLGLCNASPNCIFFDVGEIMLDVDWFFLLLGSRWWFWKAEEAAYFESSRRLILKRLPLFN